MKNKSISLMYIGSFIAMFITMYAMVYVWDHVYVNINKIYMAGLMTAAMGIVNATVMGQMYEGKLRWIILVISTISLVVIYIFIRQQIFVNDTRFLRSMIPHHSSAILMCERADISDPEISKLCDDIIEAQKEEIAIMERMLRERER